MSSPRLHLLKTYSTFLLYVVSIFLVAFFVFALRGSNVEVLLHSESNIAAARVEAPIAVALPAAVSHVATPDAVKALYMSACVAATPSFRDSLVQLVDTTELNSIMIDVKDFSGTISFPSGLAGDKGTGCRVADLPDFIRTLHEKNIYTIARITVFQDPFYATLHPELAVKKKTATSTVWSDRKGIHFIDVSARPYWDYVADIARASHAIGFDEINFDYIRFPSDGDMEDIYFPYSNEFIASFPVTWRAEALERFFKYLHIEMEETNVTTSADIFGMTTTSLNQFDLNIGQVLERALPYFDYVAPMVYPSHYPANFNGWKDPNDYPGELIQYVMQGAVDKVNVYKNATTTSSEIAEKISTDQLRPWIQDFDYGGDYDAVDVRAQIDATYAVGLDSWMLWAPSNRYTREALKVE
jgi:hypothetical protein